jgi:hypothetical protein
MSLDEFAFGLNRLVFKQRRRHNFLAPCRLNKWGIRKTRVVVYALLFPYCTQSRSLSAILETISGRETRKGFYPSHTVYLVRSVFMLHGAGLDTTVSKTKFIPPPLASSKPRNPNRNPPYGYLPSFNLWTR